MKKAPYKFPDSKVTSDILTKTQKILSKTSKFQKLKPTFVIFVYQIVADYLILIPILCFHSTVKHGDNTDKENNTVPSLCLHEIDSVLGLTFEMFYCHICFVKHLLCASALCYKSEHSWKKILT